MTTNDRRRLLAAQTLTLAAATALAVWHVLPWLLAIGIEHGPLASAAALGIPAGAGILGGLCLAKARAAR